MARLFAHITALFAMDLKAQPPLSRSAMPHRVSSCHRPRREAVSSRRGLPWAALLLPAIRASALALLLTACSPQVVPLGPPALGYGLDQAELATPTPRGEASANPAPLAEPLAMPDGALLPQRIWPAEGGPPRAILLALHGFNEHSGNFLLDSVAALNAAGIEVHAIDQRGFGLAPARGYWAGTDIMEHDAAAAARLLKSQHPDLPLFLMGESMGAAISLLAATAEPPPPIDGLVLLAPAFWSRAAIGPVGNGLFWLLAHSLPALGIRGTVGGITASDNIDALRRNGRDPLVLKATRIDAAWGLLDAMDRATAALPRCCAMPTLILQGGKDAVVPPDVTHNSLSRMPPGPRLARYESGYHLLLRDSIRPVVVADLLAWMADPHAPLPSGADRAGAAWLATAP
jgi:alpha-beta hydrolase superfamily lysophospholipase